MKFKVTKKDLRLFVLYCGILLYFCAIAVLNFDSFANDGTFYGILPFKAFTFEYIGYTFALFIAVLVLIFSSVSSYIFDKDKDGKFGIHLGEKSSDGYSKWASEKEIKNDKGIEKIDPKADKLEYAGIPLINNGKEVYVDNGEYHNLIIGSTGSGKSQCIVIPLVNILAKKGESMIISDPKGELYANSANYLKSLGYEIIVLNFRDPARGNAWNPLGLPYYYYKNGNVDKGIELLEDVAQNIICDPKSPDPFWERSSADYFSGISLGLFEDAKEKEINLNSINYMSTIGEERRGTSNYIKEYFGLKGEDSPAYIFASNTINAPGDTKGGILSVFRQKIRLFSTRENLSEMLSHGDFDMTEIGKKKTAVFMMIHDEKKTYHGLMTIFVKQCYETLIDCAQKNGGKLEYRTNFILDEFANMPPLKDVDSMVTAARSRNIRFTFIIQNFAQLNDVYGEEVAQVIKGNCNNLVYLISTELKALEEISTMCGEVKSKEKDKTASTPLVTVSDLQKLKLFQAIILRSRKNPFKTHLTPDFKMDWGIDVEKAELPSRKVSKIELFDIKKFVSDKKKDETLNNGNPFGNNPFMGGFNPFMHNEEKPMNNNPFKESVEPKGNPFLHNQANPYANLSNEDIDNMVADIEKKLKALEEEEEKETTKENVHKTDIQDEKSVIEALSTPIKEKPIYDNKFDSLEDAITQIEKNEKSNKDEDIDRTQEIKFNDIEKPKINVDKDSKIINENVVTDDEFYDDFFDDE